MLSEEGRDRVKQRQSIQPVGDASDMDEGDGDGQATGEPPTKGARGGGDPPGHHDSGGLAGDRLPTGGANQDIRDESSR